MAATEVTGPGAVSSVGNGVSAHACSMSLLVSPAGNTAVPVNGLGIGTTSEQSIMVDVSWPRTAIFANAAANVDAMCA
jgi:hypothetical protein